MDREAAEGRAARENREAEDRHEFKRVARRQGNDWEVVRFRVPEQMRGADLTESIEAKPKPPEPDDPRSNVGRMLPYHGV